MVNEMAPWFTELPQQSTQTSRSRTGIAGHRFVGEKKERGKVESAPKLAT